MPTGNPLNTSIDPATGQIIPPGLDLIHITPGVPAPGPNPYNFSLPRGGRWIFIVQVSSHSTAASNTSRVQIAIDGVVQYTSTHFCVQANVKYTHVFATFEKIVPAGGSGPHTLQATQTGFGSVFDSDDLIRVLAIRREIF